MATRCLTLSLNAGIWTLPGATRAKSRETVHTIVAVSAGAAGGFFGVFGLPFELPFTTTVMLRSIAAIARSEGEDLQSPEARLACLEVFGLGGRSSSDDAVESAYYSARLGLAEALDQAARELTTGAIAQGTASRLATFISRIGNRFGVSISEKVLGDSIPLFGAAFGAVLNLIFIRHFQRMARGHFIVRRLERTCGAETVRAAYVEA